MKAVDAVVEILKREGVEFLIGYPLNDIIEAAARADMHTIIPRQERTGLHMADGFSRINAGRPLGVFVMQQGPGAENSFGGVAQAYGESVPMVVLPAGYPRRLAQQPPNFSTAANYQRITKWAEQVACADIIGDALRRAFARARNGRPRPVVVEIPVDLMQEEISEPLDYTPAPSARAGPDPRDVEEAARVLVEAPRPLIYAGQGIHYARAWEGLRQLAELLAAPVVTSLEGKSAFPENHPLSLGTGGRSMPRTVPHFLQRADAILGIGCSFAATSYGVSMPPGKTMVHATLDAADLHQDLRADHVLLGDARLTLEALVQAVADRLGTRQRDSAPLAAEIAAVKTAWMAQWQAKLNSDEKPLTPYRVIRELMQAVDRANAIITHDSGSPRDQLSPFWECVAPLTYIGWGKTTQLGYGLGLAMGAKLAAPDKLCINVWGDAAIGFTGMDFETAVRERIPILSVLLNNSSMAIELPVMEVATEKYRSTDISGNYAAMAQAFGGYGERVEEPGEIAPAIARAIAQTREGTPALLEFITAKELELSLF